MPNVEPIQNEDSAHTLKTSRYTELMEQIADTSLDGSLVTLEAGSCGFLSLPSFNTLRQQLLEWWENLLINIAQAAIKSSH